VPSGPSSAAVALALALLPAHAGCRHDRERQHEHPMDLPAVGASLAVRLNGSSRDVPLASLTSDAGGVTLDAVWKAAWPNEDPSRLSFDLVGSDGFRPTSRPKCTRLLTVGSSPEGAWTRPPMT
jgi:hypothetical protein